MADVSAERVKQLREKTGAGMMDCKRALVESEGDIEAATDWLRKKGLAAAAKKTGRITAEGLVGAFVGDRVGALVEVNIETDFASRNPDFRTFVSTVAPMAAQVGGDAELLKAAAYPGTGRSVQDELTHLIASMGENMNLRRAAMLSVTSGVVGAYMHNAQAPGLGKIGVLVGLESTAPADRLEPLAKQLAMHVAASNPQFLDRGSVDPAALDRERAIFMAQAEASGKPADVAAKMVEGRLRKSYFEDVCLVEQVFVVDGKSKVADVVDKTAKELNTPIRVTGFVRFALGEGIERQGKDFAAEVAKAVQG